VWVLYTTGTSGGSGTWVPLDLLPVGVADPTLWEGTLVGPAPAVQHFMVQAVSGTGLTTLATNFGEYFQPAYFPPNPVQPAETSLTFITPPPRASTPTPAGSK